MLDFLFQYVELGWLDGNGLDGPQYQAAFSCLTLLYIDIDIDIDMKGRCSDCDL